ncbi:myogenesis-regulating glycosidase-like [Liolophura sinensis]|uniref:myogenesis-regulating glycosidase-like n=1 Tax=Liolophura sinensis TaxID=3198878 RepID=UPI003158B669
MALKNQFMLPVSAGAKYLECGKQKPKKKSRRRKIVNSLGIDKWNGDGQKRGQHKISFHSSKANVGEAPFLHGILRGFPKGKSISQDKSSCIVHLGQDSVKFNQLATLTISTQELEQRPEIEYITVSLEAQSRDYTPEIELDLEPRNVHWYGGSELFTQQWPMTNTLMVDGPYLSNDYVDRRHTRECGPVLERYWINSRGVGVCVDNTVPLHVSWDGTYGRFRLKAKYDNSQYSSMKCSDDSLPVLCLTIYKASNVKEVHQTMSSICFSKPLGKPDERMIRSPIWSTWATYKVNIDQKKILDLAQDILSHGFSNSQLEIDDMFSSSYGDIDFSEAKFGDPKAMMDTLKNMGFRVTLWVVPFANIDSTAFKEGTKEGYFMKEPRGEAPALVRWWQGIGAVLDLTNPQAVEWYSKRLRNIQQDYGVDSFKFDAGELVYLPMNFKTFRPMKTPGEYTTLYGKLIGSFGGMVEMRSAFMSQEYAYFVRVMDKESCWGYENGLLSMIPSVLTIGLLGYPYVLPDMIGGNAYGENGEILETVLPQRELYIRWLELTAYLPSMQFSVLPWQYDEEVVQLARKFVNIHERMVAPRVLEAIEDAQANGIPLIRPIWWLAPEDEDALQVDSEFMVGDFLLVAPILEDAQRQRSIYLPEGKWRDELRGCELDGKIWLQDYRIELDQVATFVKF